MNLNQSANVVRVFCIIFEVCLSVLSLFKIKSVKAESFKVLGFSYLYQSTPTSKRFLIANNIRRFDY